MFDHMFRHVFNLKDLFVASAPKISRQACAQQEEKNNHSLWTSG